MYEIFAGRHVDAQGKRAALGHEVQPQATFFVASDQQLTA